MTPLKVGQLRLSDNFIYKIIDVGLGISTVQIIKFQSGEDADWSRQTSWLNKDIITDPLYIDMEKELDNL